MGVTPFIMVLIGCPQGTAACEPIATMPVAYASETQCLQARSDILSASSGLGFARVVAECRPQERNIKQDAKLRTIPSA